MKPYYQDEWVTIYHGDCREILPQLDKVDLVLTDPPYGINIASTGKVGGSVLANNTRHIVSDWDSKTIDGFVISRIISHGRQAMIFGGNYFTDLLPVGRHWLVWDKKNTMPTFSDCELAWTNIDRKSVKLLTFEYNGLIGKREARVHPTQKPVEVMQWVIRGIKNAQTILDPFMGSGTTLVACAKLGRRGIGIEIDEGYFDIACRRVEKAYAQPDLFVERPAPPQQLDMLEGGEHG